jgi:hypothetical protein
MDPVPLFARHRLFRRAGPPVHVNRCLHQGEVNLHRHEFIELAASLEERDAGGLGRLDDLVEGFTGLDLAAVANRDLRDEVAGDGQGGWTDQGDNDLRALRPGWCAVSGVPFALLDPAANHGRAALILHQGGAPAFAEQAEIPVGRCAARAYLLHASAWSGAGDLVGRCEFRYQDGSTAAATMVAGQQLADWWGSEARLAAALPVERPAPLRSPVTLYAAAVANPHPERVIRALALLCPAQRSRAYWMVLAATLGHGQDPLVPTMWVDGKPVAPGQEREALGLLDPESLALEPLPARAQAGAAIELSVDVGSVLRPTPRQAAGLAVHRILGYGTGRWSMPFHRDPPHAWMLSDGMERRLRELRLPMTRFYGVGDEPIVVEQAIDRIAEFTRRAGIPQDWTVLELERQGAQVALPPERWAAAVRHVVARGYGFRRWELGNEVYTGGLWKTHGEAFPTPGHYIDHARAVAAAIRAEQPSALIGVSFFGRSTAWGNLVLKRLAGSYDFAVGHWYQFNVDERDFAATVIDENHADLERIRRTGALIAAYNPARTVTQIDTEWGLHAQPGPERHTSLPPGDRVMAYERNGNLTGAMVRAVRLIHYLREGVVEGACGWGLFGLGRFPAFTTLPVEDATRERTTVLYWLHHQFARHCGGQVLDTTGTVPFRTAGRLLYGREGMAVPLTPVLATADADAVYLIVANGSWERSFPARIDLRGFAASAVEGTVLNQDDPDAPALLERPEDVLRALPVTLEGDRIAFTLPAHALVFVRVAGVRR